MTPSETSPNHQIYWSSELINELEDFFHTDTFKQKLSNLMFQFNTDKTNENISRFTDLLLTTVRSCSNKKPKPNTHKAKPFLRNSWFDVECKNPKKEIKLLAKHMQKHPDCTHKTLNNYWKAKREYKTLTRQKGHRAIAELHAKLEATKINNLRSFWNKIIASKQTIEEPIPININHFYTHFSNLNDGPLPTKLIKATPGNETNSRTDTPFTEEEVLIAIKRLKRHEAPGPDGLPPVVFRLFNNSLVSHLTTLYNSVESFPEASRLSKPENSI